MNREEAIRRIWVHNRIHAMREPTAILITEALDMAIDALLGPQPDSITGLAPWRTEARKRFADVANEYAINQFAADTNVARSPWVKTSDRLPDKCDETKYLIARQRICGEWHTLQVTGLYIKKNPTRCPWWMSIPLLPEVEK